MELKDFIKRTLVSIVTAVHEANTETNRFQISGKFHGDKNINGETVEFDVSVTVSESNEDTAKGGIGIKLASVSGDMKQTESTQNVHRLKFNIFVTETEQ